MAKSCGIRIGPKRYEIVVLDGSAKKHRIIAFQAGEFPAGGESPVADAARVLKEAAKTHNIPHDTVGVAIDSGLAAFRTIKLPFSDPNKIEEVLKFEVESQLPQWAIDEVVVDWSARDQNDKESDLLVTAVPKSEIAKVLEIATKAGIEPLEVEIEATAMVNAAMGADICHPNDAQVLVHIGEASTAVVVVDGGRVRSMRAIHLGALSHDTGVTEAEAPAAEAAPAGTEEAVPATKPVIATPTTPEELQRLLEHAVSRIRRELGRTVSGARTTNPIDAIYVCGIELPDLIGTQVLDLPIYALDVFEEDSGQPMEGAGPLVVAYGAALRQLGAVGQPASLRREELRYTGAFERIELPIAVASLLLVTLLAVFVIFETKLGQLRDGDVDYWRRYANLYMLGDQAKGQAGDLEQPPKSLTDYLAFTRKESEKRNPGVSAKENPEIDPERTRLEQMKNEQRLLRLEVASLDKKLGNTGEVLKPQSALEATTLTLDVLGELGEAQVGRVAIRKLNATYIAGRTNGTDKVEVQVDFTFFAEDSVEATAHLDRYIAELRKKPWVVEVAQGGSKALPENPAENKGIYTESFKVTCDLSKVDREGCPVKAFFSNFSLARWIILVSLLASIGLGFYGYKLHARRIALERALSSEARTIALDLRNLARQHSVLTKQLDREGLDEQSDPVTYIRRIAASKDVQIGDTTVDPPQESEYIKGVLDTRYGIKPSVRDRGYGRLNIANFLFKLESESRRMRVTRLRMEPKAKGLKPEIVLEDDSWLWEAEVTSRSKIDLPPPATKPK